MMPRRPTMKAVRLHAYGPANLLRYEDAPCPDPAEGAILVRVHAAGVNPLDWKIRAGYLQSFFPYTLPIIIGLDFSGTVTAVGAGVTTFAPGDEVYGRADPMRLGAYAEYIVVRPDEVASKPRSVDHIHAAAVPLAALAAWQALIEGPNSSPSIGIAAGERLLIHGAAGGVGSFAVPFAKACGAYVIATARADNIDFVRSLGADEVIGPALQHFEEVGPVDAVLDLVGGETLERSWALLREGGALASMVGFPTAEEGRAHGVRAFGIMAQSDAGQLAEFARLIDDGAINPVVSELYPLAEAARAHARLEAGGVRGKIVLEVGG